LAAHAFLAFCCTIGLNLGFQRAFPVANESVDFRTFYDPAARSLLAGDGYPLGGDTSLSYPPGFPLVLAGVYWVAGQTAVTDTTALTAMALLCMGAGAVFVFLIARLMWESHWALAAAVAWSAYPLNLWLAKQPNSELVFLVPYYGAVYMGLRASLAREPVGRGLVAGFLSGAAMLVRPIAVGLGCTLAFSLVVSARRTRRTGLAAVAVLVGSVMVALPWELWIYHKTGKQVLLSTNGPPSIADGMTFALPRSHRVGSFPVPPADLVALMTELDEAIHRQPDALRSTGALLRTVAPVIGARPWASARLFLFKLSRAWYGTDSGHREIAVLVIQVPVLAMLALSAIACRKARSTTRVCLQQIMLQVGYFWIMAVLGLSIVRYMTPTIGLLFVFTPALLKAPYAADGATKDAGDLRA
jgi:hypothetical protein